MTPSTNRRARVSRDDLRRLAFRTELLRDRLFRLFGILEACRRAARTPKRLDDPDFVTDALGATAEMAYCGGIEAGLIFEGLSGETLPLRPEIARLRQELRLRKRCQRSKESRRVRR